MAAYRCDDRYLRDGDRWVFASRELRFMYNVPFEQMPASFADSRRIRLPGLRGGGLPFLDTEQH